MASKGQKTIKCCSCTLCVFSIFLFLFAIAIVLAGLIASNAAILEEVKVPLPSNEVGGEDLQMPINFFIISFGLMFGLITWFISLCGCCSSLKKHKCCLFMLCISSLLVFVLFLVFSSIFIVLGSYGDDYIHDRCTKQQANELTGMEQTMFEQAVNLDKNILDATNYMCTKTCPCYSGEDHKAFDKYNAYTEEEFNKYGRTKLGMCIETEETIRTRLEQEYVASQGGDTQSVQATQQDMQRICDPSASQDNTSGGHQPLVWYSFKQYSHNNLKACLDSSLQMLQNSDQLKPEEKIRLTDQIRSVNDQITDDMKQKIEFLEDNYNCSGVCGKSLFYFTKDLISGLPETTCSLGMMDSVADEFTLFGYSILLSGVCIFIMIILQFPLCCYDSSKDAQENIHQNLGDDNNEVEMNDVGQRQ